LLVSNGYRLIRKNMLGRRGGGVAPYVRAAGVHESLHSKVDEEGWMRSELRAGL